MAQSSRKEAVDVYEWEEGEFDYRVDHNGFYRKKHGCEDWLVTSPWLPSLRRQLIKLARDAAALLEISDSFGRKFIVDVEKNRDESSQGLADQPESVNETARIEDLARRAGSLGLRIELHPPWTGRDDLAAPGLWGVQAYLGGGRLQREWFDSSLGDALNRLASYLDQMEGSVNGAS